jgi:hypothetical protein
MNKFFKREYTANALQAVTAGGVSKNVFPRQPSDSDIGYCMDAQGSV